MTPTERILYRLSGVLTVNAYLLVAALAIGQPPAVPDPPRVLPPDPPRVVSVSAVLTYTTRAPYGHTHTCANGHTWDHSVTPGHNCPVCGMSQFAQDPFPRVVTVTHGGLSAAAPSYRLTPPLAHGSFSGCANGQCEAGSSRPVLFPRLRGVRP